MPEKQIETVELSLGGLKDKLEEAHPLMYADQIMSLAIGPFVSRVTFGSENHLASSRNPVATIVMPTNQLHAVAAELVKQLSSEEFKKHSASQFQAYIGPEAFNK